MFPVTYMIAVFALSSIPGTVRPDDPFGRGLFIWMPPTVQNTLHVPVFGLLAWLWCWSLKSWTARIEARVLLAFVLSCLYAILDEWYQTTVPGRFGSLTDLLLNVVGVTLGVSIFGWAAGKRVEHPETGP